MTEAQLASLSRYKSGTNSNNFPNTDLQPLLNYFKDEICSLVTQSHGSYFLIPTTDDLVAARREYAYPRTVLNHIETVEVAFNQDSPIEYILAKKIKRSDYNKSLAEANIANDFINDEPKYFIRRRAIYLLTGTISSTVLGAATVAEGIRMTYRKYPENFASALDGTTELSIDPSTSTFGFPRQFHELLARRVSMEYKDKNGIVLSRSELNYEKDLQEQLNAISREDLSEAILSSVPTNEGYDF